MSAYGPDGKGIDRGGGPSPPPYGGGGPPDRVERSAERSSSRNNNRGRRRRSRSWSRSPERGRRVRSRSRSPPVAHPPRDGRYRSRERSYSASPGGGRRYDDERDRYRYPPPPDAYGRPPRDYPPRDYPAPGGRDYPPPPRDYGPPPPHPRYGYPPPPGPPHHPDEFRGPPPPPGRMPRDGPPPPFSPHGPPPPHMRGDFGPPPHMDPYFRGPPPPGPPGGGGGRRGGRRDEGPPGVSLLIRNVSPDITTQDLQVAFGRIGDIRDVYIPRDFHSQQPKGFAFIEYATAAMAAEAREEMNRFVMKGRELEVVFAQERRKTPNEMRGRVVNQQNYQGEGGRGPSAEPGRNERSSSFERAKQREREDRKDDRAKIEGDSGRK